MAAVEQRDTTVASDVAAFWRLWAIAVIAHVVGNTAGGELRASGLVNAVLGLVAIVVVLRPEHGVARTALAGGVLVSAFVEAPFLGNHWFLAAAVSAGALIAGPSRGPDDFWSRFAPTGRVLLLVFYSFAAFAKINAGFFDPVESCARFFTNRGLSFWQLPELSGGSPASAVLPFLVAAIELSVPVLLVLRPTRRIGVALAALFHLLLTLDLEGHFFDFTLVLIPLFLLFAAPGVLTAVDRRLPRLRLFGGAPWIALAAAAVIISGTPAPVTPRALVLVMVWGVWLWLGALLAWAIVRERWDSPSLSFRPPNLAAAALIALVVLNGSSPYLELKTATGFNMYANLLSGGGESNHFLVPRTAELRGGQDDLAVIVATDDDELAEYVDSGFGLPMVNLRDYLAAHAEISVTFERGGETVVVERAADHPDLLRSQPLLVEKFLFLRAVPLHDPPACQALWLPAR